MSRVLEMVRSRCWPRAAALALMSIGVAACSSDTSRFNDNPFAALSHPETTSHRGMTSGEREALGITGGTIRLSVGTESSEFICEALAQGLTAID